MRLILKDIKAVGQRRYYHTKRDTLNGWFRKAVGARRLPAAESIAGAYVAGRENTKDTSETSTFSSLEIFSTLFIANQPDVDS